MSIGVFLLRLISLAFMVSELKFEILSFKKRFFCIEKESEGLPKNNSEAIKIVKKNFIKKKGVMFLGL